ncbi:hypothetical protein V2J09_017944, partial [Rumex salicifolius]
RENEKKEGSNRKSRQDGALQVEADHLSLREFLIKELFVLPLLRFQFATSLSAVPCGPNIPFSKTPKHALIPSQFDYSMSSKRLSSNATEKPRLDCAPQTDVKPFSIRNFVSITRQKNVAQSWPFQQKYLKIILDHGISDVLPPLETHNHNANGRSITNTSLNQKRSCVFGKNCGVGKQKTESISRRGKDFVSLHNTITHLSQKLARLSLSSNGDKIVGQKQLLYATPNPQSSGNQSSYKMQNICYENTGDKGVERKGKTKMKSLAEILAVAKHCILDSHGRINVSGADSKAPEPNEGCRLIKKHQRRDDFVAGVFEYSKRSRTTRVSNLRYKEGKCKSCWGREDSCKTAQTQQKPGGYGSKFVETSPSIQEERF